MRQAGRRSAAILAMALASGAAQAHFLWIEREGAAAKVYFGEWASGLRESDQGPMKAIQNATAFDAARAPLALERKADHFLIARPGSGDLHVFDEVMHRSAKVVYEIRDGRSATQPLANFELVPQAPGSNTLTLYLDGKPLPEAEFTVFGPPKWEKTFKTDKAGRATIETPWAGYYLLRAQYDDDTAGEFEGKKFDKIINVAILSFTVDSGAPWPP